MRVEFETIKKAEEKLGDKTADIISELLHLQGYDSRNRKALCPFHDEDTPSFIYDAKEHFFHCFGCKRTVGIVSAYMETGCTYLEAVEKLSEVSGYPITLGEKGVKTRYQYKYPYPEQNEDKEKVYTYLGTRGISKETIDKLDIRQDDKGNVVFNYYDTNDVLTMVKYRPSHKLNKEKNEIKNWCQPGAGTSHLLFNMNRVNTDLPLLITEGEMDTAAAIEAGFSNAVSIPFGAQDFKWIEENFDWLEDFKTIIICSDNDVPGTSMQKECVFRLGSWRTKVIDIPHVMTDSNEKEYRVKDLNEVLFIGGKQAVLDLIQEAKDSPVPSVEDLSDVKDIDLNDIEGVYTGIQQLDSKIMKLFYGTLTVVSGTPGCVDCDTKFFNGKKWKHISDYNKKDKVLQFNADGTTELVYPQRYIKEKCDEMYLFYDTHINQCLSKEHNLVYVDEDKNLKKISVEEYLKMAPRPNLKIVRNDVLGDEVGYINFLTHDISGNDMFITSIYHGNKEPIKMEPKDGYKYCFTVPSGMLVLKRKGVINITGNSGKSSFLSQVMCQAMEQGINTWLFSGEMSNCQTKSWLNSILAGRRNVGEYMDVNETIYYRVPLPIKQQIADHYKGKWFIYKDDESPKLEALITSMTDSVRKYGTRLLILDNLMTIDLGQNESNVLIKQTDAITQLIAFAKKFSVALVLVAHPRKLPAGEEVGLYDISGTSNIINLAHRTLGINRLKKKDGNIHDVRITVIKDRMRGKTNEAVDMYYDEASRRFYTNETEYNYQYSWDTGEHTPLPYPHPEEFEVYGEMKDGKPSIR